MSEFVPWEATIVATNNQVSADMAGEALILNLANGQYYGLDPVGSWIWALIQKPHRVADVRDAILQEFEVEPERCAEDLQALLHDLVQHGLIEIGLPAASP